MLFAVFVSVSVSVVVGMFVCLYVGTVCWYMYISSE